MSKNECSCCAAIAKEKAPRTLFLCEDCRMNAPLRDEFHWYRMTLQHRSFSLIFTILYPSYVIASLWFGLMRWYGVAGCVVVFILFLNAAKIAGIPKRLRESEEKLWLLKLKGPDRKVDDSMDYFMER